MADTQERNSRLVGDGDINVSFEFFPPKTEKMEETLWSGDPAARAAAPALRVGHLRRRRLDARAHAHHRGAPRARDGADAGRASDLRAGDQGRGRRGGARLQGGGRAPHRGPARRSAGRRRHQLQPHPGGYANAADLVAGLKQIANFEISVAGYPEKHPDSPSLAADLDNLKAKVDAGADRIITQFFFDNAHYLRFLEAPARAGIWVPIIPGIVPIHNFKQVAGFAGRGGASMPSWMARRFDGLDDDPQTTHLVAAAVAAEQVMDLVDQGIRQFHFYTLNRADLVYAICHLLGLRPLTGKPMAPRPRRPWQRIGADPCEDKRASPR